MRITTTFFTLLFFTGIFFSCKKGGTDNSTPVIPPPSVIQVTTASGVMGGPKNTSITIAGTNLPTNTSAITVTINSKVCTVVSASATSLVVKVPPYAGTGNVVINFNGVITNGPVFNYEYTYGLVSITNGVVGYQDGPLASAQWDETGGLCVDTANNIFTSAYMNPVVRKITADLSTVSTLAGDRTIGDVNAQGTAAKLGYVDNISIDKAGTIYYADQSYNKIKKIDKSGNVTSLITNAVAGSYPISAQVGSLGNIYVTGNDRSVSKFNAAGVLQWKVRSHSLATTGNSTDGDSSVVKFDGIGFGNLAIENGETALYFSTMTPAAAGSSWASQVKKLNLTNLNTTTLTGSVTGTAAVDGPAASSTFNLVTGLALDATGGLYIADGYNNRIRYLKNATVSTIIGAAGSGDVDGPPATAKISYPDGLGLTGKGDLIIGCLGNKKYKRLIID